MLKRCPSDGPFWQPVQHRDVRVGAFVLRLLFARPFLRRPPWSCWLHHGFVQHDARVNTKGGCQVHQDGQGHVGLAGFDLLNISSLKTRLLRQDFLRPSLPFSQTPRVRGNIPQPRTDGGVRHVRGLARLASDKHARLFVFP